MGLKVVVGRGIVELKPPAPAKRKFDNFIKAYMSYTEENEASEKIHMWTALAVISAALERKVWLKRQHHTVFPNLYVVVVGNPGIVRKSTSTGIGVDLLRRLTTVQFLPERVTDAAMIDILQRSGDKFSYEGQDIKHSSLFCYSGELSVLLKDTHGIVAEAFTTFYDCTPYDSNTPWVSETKGSGKIEVFGPCMSLLGCTTESALKDCISPHRMEGGLASRILFVVEKGPRKKLIPIPKHDALIEKLGQELVDDLRIINNIRGPMTLTPAAITRFEEFYRQNDTDQKDRYNDARFSGYFGRKPSLVEKLAMIASASESDSRVIEAYHIEAGILWTGMLEENMFDVFKATGKYQGAEELYKVLEFIVKNGTASEASIMNHFWRDIDQENTKKILNQLSAMGQIVIKSFGSGTVLYAPKPGAEPLR